MRRLIATLRGVGRWTLMSVVAGLALIGFLHLTRGTAVRHVRGVAADGVAIGVAEEEFPLMATGAWLAPGNRVEVMQNGDSTFPRLWDDLRRRGDTDGARSKAGRRDGSGLSRRLRQAYEVTVEVFRARSPLQRIGELGANWLTRLL